MSISPRFHDKTESEEKLDFEIKCTLRGSEPWIEPAPHLILPAGGNSFQVKLKPDLYRNNNETGYQHGQILGFDSNNPEAGPLFRIPVTRVNHYTFDQQSVEKGEFKYQKSADFTTGKIIRQFFAVPQGCTLASFVFLGFCCLKDIFIFIFFGGFGFL